MGKNSRDNSRDELSLLLVGLPRREREALARELAAAAPGVRLLPAATPADAWSCLQARRADAVLCEWSVFPALRHRLETNSPQARTVPLLVLVPPGAEEPATALQECESADFVLQAGNYPRWLLARLRRALYRQENSWQEAARVIRHELNNPLTGVLGNAELVLAESPALPDRVRQRLATIINLTERLRDVVRDLEGRFGSHGSARRGAPPPDLSQPVTLGREVLR